MSCGHMEGVSAENGPPGVGVKSVWLLLELGLILMLMPSPVAEAMMFSSSSSDNVSTVN